LIQCNKVVITSLIRYSSSLMPEVCLSVQNAL
jgi:hypothetical protein